MQVINQRLRCVNLSSVVDHLAQVAQSCLNPLFYLYNKYLVLTDYNMIALKQIITTSNVDILTTACFTLIVIFVGLKFGT